MGRCRRHGCEGCSRRATGKRRPDKHVVHPVPVQAFGHRGDLNVRHRNARVGVSPGATPMAPLSLGGGLSAEFSCHLGRRPGRRPLFASHSLTASRWVSGGSRRIRNSKPAASWPALDDSPRFSPSVPIRLDAQGIGVFRCLVRPFHFDPMAFSHVVGPVRPVHSSTRQAYYEVVRDGW